MNLAGGISLAYPTTGSFSRTAVNASFGATSSLAGFISAFLVLLAIYILLDTIAYLPLASLAPLIIQGAIGVINFKEFGEAYRMSGPEFGVMAATFLVSLGMTVKQGLLVGV